LGLQREVTPHYELWVVDDGSSDATWARVQEAKEQHAQLRAVRLSRNFGKEAATSAGLTFARGDVVIVMDGDLQHPPGELPRMVRRWQEGGVDIVEMVKEERQREGVLDRLAAQLYYSVFGLLGGMDLRNQSDFKLMARPVVDAYLTLGEANLFLRGMVAWLGFRHVQLPFHVAERTRGSSKWSFSAKVHLAIDSLTSFTTAPLSIITFLGITFLGLATMLGAQTLWRWWHGVAVEGFTTVILLQLIIGSTLMISLGLIGLYIGRIYVEVKHRPRFIVSEKL
jgi:Glycosyltransferases involved in cell wall biogenesis